MKNSENLGEIFDEKLCEKFCNIFGEKFDEKLSKKSCEIVCEELVENIGNELGVCIFSGSERYKWCQRRGILVS